MKTFLFVSLSMIAAVVDSAAPVEHILNGSFETGDFTDWTIGTTNRPFRPWNVDGSGHGGGFGMQQTSPM